MGHTLQQTAQSLRSDFRLAGLAVVLYLFLSSALVFAEGETTTTTQTARVNAITSAAVQQGVLGCAGRVEQVTNFLGFGSEAGALIMVAPQQPDQRVLSVGMEIHTANDKAAYVSAHFSPNQANGCGAAYDAVVYWESSCNRVAETQFTGMKSVGLLKSAITVLDGGIATKVLLMPAGSGCVSIKKEVVL
ncbi:MAG: hypothetical protein HOL04_00995 [Gammaproteobacteria bacterium]|jgi:hypothetical protein|nr:hypothetical protein [Gammaproteobacteria bacterium]MBT4606636.1 hypothetical protein [Thiotrichales bacterium]MBT3472625.1 hypothetical protein [Gammaproteobacteria bacterium]MBT3967555.1 hypothetical protein [Gammaproteobacteria bacterium]MBT4080800.1 hypothetical protein [Gammaproteobacteria bacterium]